MYRLKKIFSSESSPLLLYIIISLITCFSSLHLSPITSAQTAIISPTTNLQEIEEDLLNLSPSNSKHEETAQSQQAEKDPEIQKLRKRFNIDVEEAIRIRNKKKELDALGLFSLSSGKLGNIQYQAVKLDGRIVLPLAVNIEADKDVLMVRVKKVENTLNEIIKRHLKPEEIRVFPAILNRETVLVISQRNQLENNDFEFKQRWVLMTITAADS